MLCALLAGWSSFGYETTACSVAAGWFFQTETGPCPSEDELRPLPSE
jgi:hypothetical protein